MEVYVLVEKKKSTLLEVCGIAVLVAGIVIFVMAMLGVMEFIPFAIAAVVCGWLLKNASFEYEYSYFDGEFRFAKIANKSRRKELRTYTAEELIVIAPIEDRAVYSYMKDTKVKKLDYTSGQADAKRYAMAAKAEDGIRLILFEPDEKYLDAVCIKYGQKVLR